MAAASDFVSSYKSLRLPIVFKVDFTECRYADDKNRRCFFIHDSIIDIRKTCSHCALKLMSTAMSMNEHSPTTTLLLTTDRIIEFVRLFGHTLNRLNNLFYFMQSQQTMDRFLFTMTRINQHPQISKYRKSYIRFTADFMKFIALKRRTIHWLIECGDGLYFQRFVIEEFAKYELEGFDPMAQSPQRFSRDEYNLMFPVMFHLKRFKKQYLQRARKKTKQQKGVIQGNYQWIRTILEEVVDIEIVTEEDGEIGNEVIRNVSKLDYHFCGTTGMQEIKDFRLRLKGNICCDSRECSRALVKDEMYEFKRCSRCRMMYYCSRHCQKVDWNQYNHRALCFEYGAR